MIKITTTKGLMFIILLVAISVLCIPLAAIWSINTLFGTNIDYNLSTWAAALFLISVVGRPSVSKD